MKFDEALQAMRSGKNVVRKGWYIRIHHAKNEFTNSNHEKVILTPMDFLSDDWEIANESI